MTQLLEQYLDCHPEFKFKVDSFSETNQKIILRKLKNENDKQNFLSTIREIKFGIFFLENGFEVCYDKQYNCLNKKYTPDWSLIANGQQIIAEVISINKSDSDYKRSEFENKLISEIQNIKDYLWIDFKFINKQIDLDSNITNIISQLKIWLKSRPSLNDSILINNIVFRVISVRNNLCSIFAASGSNPIEIKPSKVDYRSDFFKKFAKYNSLMVEKEVPFLICVALEFTGGYTHTDIYDLVYGNSIYDTSTKTEYHDFKSGLFYSDEQHKNVTGVISLFNNRFYFFQNFSANHKLNEHNSIILNNYKFTSGNLLNEK